MDRSMGDVHHLKTVASDAVQDHLHVILLVRAMRPGVLQHGSRQRAKTLLAADHSER
jgi:hypothetical protein